MSPELPRLPKVPTSPRELGELAQLLLEWPIRQSPRLALPLCILMAAVVQTAIVVIFSISYEAPSAKPALAPRFYFLPPDSACARQLRPWLDGNDPALFAPGRATASALPPPPPLQYRPSYEEPPPQLLPLPESVEQPVEPPIPPASFTSPKSAGTAEGGALRRSSPSPIASTPAPAPAPAAAPPRVRWLDELAARHPEGSGATLPSLPPGMSGTRPSLYQVAVGPEGLPMHCTLTDSSGNAEVDESGRAWIMGSRFQPANTLSWGRVLIPWEAAEPKSQAKSQAKSKPTP